METCSGGQKPSRQNVSEQKIVGPWNINDTHQLYGRIYKKRYNAELLRWLRNDIYVNSPYNQIDTKEHWITYLVRNLVRNVTYKHYYFLYNEYTIFRMLINFWFNITLATYDNKPVYFKAAYHRNKLEDHDKFNRRFGFDYWDNFMDRYSAEELFDESDIGIKMRLHFPQFVYSIIDVVNSKCIVEEEEEIKKAEKELEDYYEEETAHLNLHNNKKYDSYYQESNDYDN
jgi:hypothetical protein